MNTQEVLETQMDDAVRNNGTAELHTGEPPWPTILEAMDRIGVAKRTIHMLVESGRLRKAKRRERGKPTMTILHPDDVERERHERTQTTMAISDGYRETAATDATDMQLAVVQKILERLPPAPPKPNLELDDAADYSGLPKRLLTQAIRTGRLAAHRWNGTFYIPRAALDAFQPPPSVAQPQWSEASK